jgi:hypothetical protein
MGRVAKYKKIKACDPYSKKNGGRVDLKKVGMWGLGGSDRKAKKRSQKSELLRTAARSKDQEGQMSKDSICHPGGMNSIERTNGECQKSTEW